MRLRLHIDGVQVAQSRVVTNEPVGSVVSVSAACGSASCELTDLSGSYAPPNPAWTRTFSDVTINVNARYKLIKTVTTTTVVGNDPAIPAGSYPEEHVHDVTGPGQSSCRSDTSDHYGECHDWWRMYDDPPSYELSWTNVIDIYFVSLHRQPTHLIVRDDRDQQARIVRHPTTGVIMRDEVSY